MFRREQVHGTTAPLTAACFFPKQFGHDVVSRHPNTQGMNVVTIGTANIVIRSQTFDDARRNRFLPVIKVHKAKHATPVIHLGALILKVAPEHHVLINCQPLFVGQEGIGSIKYRWGPFLGHELDVSLQQFQLYRINKSDRQLGSVCNRQQSQAIMCLIKVRQHS